MKFHEVLRYNVKHNSKYKKNIDDVKQLHPLSFQTRFLKNEPTYRRQVVDPQHQTTQGQSVAEPEAPLWNILVENLNMT